MNARTTKQSGFTLIELIVVIAILGILAVFAVAKYVDLTKQSRIAVLNGVLAAAQGAAQLVHAEYLVVGSTVTVEGSTTPITLGFNGYPSAQAGGIYAAMSLSAGIGTTAATDTTGAGTFFISNAPTPAGCSFTYTPPTSTTVGPVFSTLTTTGC